MYLLSINTNSFNQKKNASGKARLPLIYLNSLEAVCKDEESYAHIDGYKWEKCPKTLLQMRPQAPDIFSREGITN